MSALPNSPRRTSADRFKEGPHRRLLATALTVALVGCLWILGCNDQKTTTTAGSRVQLTPAKSSKTLRAEKYADVTDAKALIEGWKEELIEAGDFKPDEEGVLRTEQFSFGYAWNFSDTGAELAVTEERQPDGRPKQGRDLLYQFMDEAMYLWGEGGAPQFIREKDGAAGDEALKNLQQKVIEAAKAHAKENDDSGSLEVLESTSDSWMQLRTAYNLLLNSGSHFEGDTITGNIWEFKATGTYDGDGKVQCHFTLTALDGSDEGSAE